jgi:prolyl 4-hydroxylase
MEPPDETRALIQAANGGDLVAMTEVGRRLLVGRDAPHAPDKGAAMILAAAGRGHGEALAHAAVILAAGVVAPPNWSQALEQLRRAVAVGYGPAIGQLAALEAFAETTTPPGPEPVSTAPKVWWVRGIAPPAACRWLIERARGRTDAATVYNAAVGRLDKVDDRSNTLFEFNLAEADMVVMWLRARIAAALSLPQARLEPSNVLHYTPGQRFSRHFDFLAPDVPAWAEELATKGQRTATALVYLNDDFEGGETEFNKLGQRFRGAMGDALFFSNVGAWGAPDPETLHAGLPTTSGEKWLFSQFVRDRDQG